MKSPPPRLFNLRKIFDPLFIRHLRVSIPLSDRHVPSKTGSAILTPNTRVWQRSSFNPKPLKYFLILSWSHFAVWEPLSIGIKFQNWPCFCKNMSTTTLQIPSSQKSGSASCFSYPLSWVKFFIAIKTVEYSYWTWKERTESYMHSYTRIEALIFKFKKELCCLLTQVLHFASCW